MDDRSEANEVYRIRRWKAITFYSLAQHRSGATALPAQAAFPATFGSCEMSAPIFEIQNESG